MEIEQATTQDNSRKLDKILFLIEGEEGSPGVLGRLTAHSETLYGIHGSMGLVQKVNVMWRAHTWILCTMSAGVGYCIKAFIK